MSNSNAIKALVAIATCSGASAFVAPTHLGRALSAPPAPSPVNARQTSANRGEAVAPLNGFSFSSITDIFSRECAAPPPPVGCCLRQNEHMRAARACACVSPDDRVVQDVCYCGCTVCSTVCERLPMGQIFWTFFWVVFQMDWSCVCVWSSFFVCRFEPRHVYRLC